MVTLAHWTSPVDCPDVKISTDGSGPMRSTPFVHMYRSNDKYNAAVQVAYSHDTRPFLPLAKGLARQTSVYACSTSGVLN